MKHIIIVVAIQGLSMAFVLHLFLNTSYKIKGGFLIIKSGIFYKKNIRITEIKSISKTTSLLSSPAASLTKRIEINYGKFNNVIISPKNQSAFIEDLKKVNSEIKSNL
ncbi:PH domain-containing protein [Hyunsoonleella pacifica]|uniref:PH domain-containing protein n=1 Tax=Hyunsoonleella pacifica TaxID=1080224 RepID=UPI0010344505|nr:PH domain-containing protein [Hyunsoonleella pacifica]